MQLVKRDRCELEKPRIPQMKEFLTLRTNALPGDIDIHSDILSVLPAALSRKRALKAGREKQEKMSDTKPRNKCVLCDPNQRPPGTSPYQVIISDRVADFVNDFPYLPGDQRVVFLWHGDPMVRQRVLHKYQLGQLRRMDLFWLLKGCIIRGRQYKSPDDSGGDCPPPPNLLRQAPDLLRMVVGFNFGPLAGQSIPHFHAQYGWEVVLNPRSLSQNQLALYFEELKAADLIIFDQDQRIKVIAPWTPLGQYALDLYFTGKYDICDMTDEDMKLFSVFGHAIISKYLSLGIQNVNIVFTNSPNDKQIEPLTVHFVPRVSKTALYEIKGVNVVDTPPSKIAEEFRRFTGSGSEEINWAKVFEESRSYDPDKEFAKAIAFPGSGRKGKIPPSRDKGRIDKAKFNGKTGKSRNARPT
jgi:hypothetical protein